MGYTNGGLQEVRIAEAVTLNTGSDHGTFQPLYQPVVIRAVAGLTTTLNNGPITANFYKRDVSTGSNLATIDQIIFASGAALGSVFYSDGLNVTVSPGQEVVVQSSGAATGAASFTVVYEVAPEVPANQTTMTKTT